MTTPPKAKRFHTSPNASGAHVEVRKKEPQPTSAANPSAEQSNPDDALRDRLMRTDDFDDGFGNFSLNERKTADSDTTNGSDEDREASLQSVRDENLPSRQLRIARRIAKLHNIEVSSDEEAVLELRNRGIDPSHRGALGKILSAEGTLAQSKPSANAPALQSKGVSLVHRPPTSGQMRSDPLSEEERMIEIRRIQQDLARRRRRRMAMLTLRLLLFVALPTAIAGWYYYRVATPLYATESQFQIQMAEAAAAASGTSSLLASSPMATNTDAVALQSYLTSREAMNRLNADLGFKEVYQDESLDFIKRLPPDATNEATFKVYEDSVRIGYDPTEGVVNMEIIAPTPELSLQFSRALLRYAEEQVDHLTSRLRDDQMQGARENYNDAEEKVLAAQLRVQELQERLGVLDPAAEGSVIMQQVSQMESEKIKKELELNQLLSNSNPVQSRVTAVRGDIARLEELIASARTGLTGGNDTRASLAKVSGELRIAEGDLETRQVLLASAAEQLEAARIEANKQVRYLSLSVPPVPPDEPTYPRAFQNTLMAFIIFSAIYLVLSLTVSILREQVST